MQWTNQEKVGVSNRKKEILWNFELKRVKYWREVSRMCPSLKKKKRIFQTLITMHSGKKKFEEKQMKDFHKNFRKMRNEVFIL